ncbi:MAG: 2-oxoglutarate dehydrogenase complex dihydrolipoyllysine-residue succinyltransferase [Pseudomonadota bacterium]
MLIEIKVPQLAESITEANVLTWEKQEGDYVRADEKIVEIETDKVVLEVVAQEAGQLTGIVQQEGDEVTSGDLLAKIDTSVAPATSNEPAAAAPAVTEAPGAGPKTSPSVRKMAAETGIDPAAVVHDGDRVTKEDMVAHSQSQTQSTAAPAVEPAPLPVGARHEERVPMTRLRRRIAERLLGAQHENAILTTFNEVNMKPMMDLRNRYKGDFEKAHGIKLGFMSFFTKATVAALQKFPVINASVDGDDIIYHDYYDIGVAVSSERGLVVPILRDVEFMSFADVEKTIAGFGEKARTNKLALQDLEGGTFSISNGGTFGSMLSTPILNPPQSAILGMHNIVERPVAENGEVVIRPIMYVALSYDHRIIDGREAVQFLVTIKQMIEDPARLLLEV